MRSKGGPMAHWGTGNFLSRFRELTNFGCAYGVLITKNTKLGKILTIEKLTPQGGTLGRSEVEKIFCRNFANKLYIRVHMGSSSQKTQN